MDGVRWLEPIYDAAGMAAIDAWAIEERGVPALELMERAGAALAREVEGAARPGPIRILCGKGNNGGDGLVAARLLAAAGHEVEPLLLWPAAELSADAAANLQRLGGTAAELSAADAEPALAGSGAVVDAIFGTGFSGAPREPARSVIEAANRCGAPLIACDVPSGVDASSGAVAGPAIEADLTVTFHAPKLGHWIAPGKGRCGTVRVAPIGIPAGAPRSPDAGLIESDVLARAPARDAASTKFSSGEVLIVGGSRGLTGAVCLAAEAAIRCGAGYATVGCPASLEPILEAKLTEVMTVGLADRDGALEPGAAELVRRRAGRAAAVIVGPGLGRADGAARLARELLASIDAPLVIDADGLNAIGTDLSVLRGRLAPTVLTPHAGELARLLGIGTDAVQAGRLAAARRAAEESGALVVLKGDDTIVAGPDRLAVSRGDAPALATAGSGDVLSGALSALLARGMEPFSAACAAVCAHCRAGRLAGARLGNESVIASDVIAELPRGLRP